MPSSAPVLSSRATSRREKPSSVFQLDQLDRAKLGRQLCCVVICEALAAGGTAFAPPARPCPLIKHRHDARIASAQFLMAYSPLSTITPGVRSLRNGHVQM